MRELESFDFGKGRDKKPKDIRLPWDKLLDGNIYELEQGVDFHSSFQTFRVKLHNAAKRRGLKAKTVINRLKTRITIQAFPDPNNRPLTRRIH